MTIEQMKEHFFNESTELGMATELEIQQFCTWLEDNGYDADFAYDLWQEGQGF